MKAIGFLQDGVQVGAPGISEAFGFNIPQAERGIDSSQQPGPVFETLLLFSKIREVTAPQVTRILRRRTCVQEGLPAGAQPGSNVAQDAREVEVVERIEERRAVARFEPESDGESAEEKPKKELGELLDEFTGPPPAKPSGERASPMAPAEDETSYTARLFEAKRRAWKDKKR